MKISIVTTCFNAEKYIEEAIESVLFQRGNFDIEYIIIDGGSTDKTNEIISGYIKKHSENELTIRCNRLQIKYSSEKDTGMYDGITKGFKLITGDIAAYLNADDFYMPNAFSLVTRTFSEFADVDWICGIPTIYDDNGHIVYESLHTLPHKQSFIKKGFYGTIFHHIQQESCFWRKNLLDSIDLEAFSKYKLAGDFYLWRNFSDKAILYYLQSHLSGIRINSGQQ